MQSMRIHGGTRLVGTVKAGGAKNAALPLMAAALLTNGTSHLKRIPQLRDVASMAEVLSHLGAQVGRDGAAMTIDASALRDAEAPYDLVRKMRASIYVLGPLLARFGRARVSLPGGCAIGSRPIDLHLRGMRALGAEIRVEHGYVEAQAPAGGLTGADCVIEGDHGPSVGATCNVLMATALAKGQSVLRGCAIEPEVDDVAHFLAKAGARIDGIGTRTLEVEGVEGLNPIEYETIADRIEAGTFLVAGLMTRGDVTVADCRPEHMQTVLEKLAEMGASIETGKSHVRITHDGPIRPVPIRTAPYPGFPTDMQAQCMAALCLAEGESRITETIYPDRYMHAAELNRMGAEVDVTPPSAIVRGVPALSGASVMASDLRASAALILAGLVADSTTECLRIYHLDRGYERLEEKFQALGASIERVNQS